MQVAEAAEAGVMGVHEQEGVDEAAGGMKVEPAPTPAFAATAAWPVAAASAAAVGPAIAAEVAARGSYASPRPERDEEEEEKEKRKRLTKERKQEEDEEQPSLDQVAGRAFG